MLESPTLKLLNLDQSNLRTPSGKSLERLGTATPVPESVPSCGVRARGKTPSLETKLSALESFATYHPHGE